MKMEKKSGRKSNNRPYGAAYLLVITTVGTRAAARRIARALLAKRYAACVQIISGIESLYVWKGRTEAAREYLIFIKTTRRKFSLVEKLFSVIHPYDTPEIVAVPLVGMSRKYGTWMAEALK